MDWSQLYVRAFNVIERNGCPYHDILTEEEKMKSWVAEEIRAGRARLWRGCGVVVWKNICAWSGVRAEQKIKARTAKITSAKYNALADQTVVELVFTGPYDTSIYDFDLRKLGWVVAKSNDGNIKSGWALVAGRCPLNVGDDIPAFEA
jgi:hypothetical protein